MGPKANLRKVSANAADGDEIHRLTDAGPGSNVLRYIDAGLRPSVSRMRCWGLFSDITRHPRFPASGVQSSRGAAPLRRSGPPRYVYPTLQKHVI